MGKHKVDSASVNCPVCNVLCKTRGLHSHLRLSHPEVDSMRYLRKRVVKPLNKGERIMLQILEMPTGQWRIKHVGLNEDDIKMIFELISHLKEDGHFRNHPKYDSGDYQ
jgi:ribosomal protein S15P/S13E